MSKAATGTKDSAKGAITNLVEVSKLDTLYRDIYLDRARTLLEPLLTSSNYKYLKESLASLTWIERQLRSAVERGDWKKSQELTEHIRKTKASATASTEALKLGEEVYDGLSDIPIDPFSPGFDVFMGGSEKLMELRARAIQILTKLESIDSGEKEFYARRRADFQKLSIKISSSPKEEKVAAGPAELQQNALKALDSGDLSQLQDIVSKLMSKPAAPQKTDKAPEVSHVEVAELGEDLLYSFSDATLAAASRLGLTPVRTKSRRHFAHLVPHGWQPSFMKGESRQWSKDQISRLTYPSETTAKGKEAIEFYLLNPFLTSSGTRFHVPLAVEDLLIENFPEPEAKDVLPQTPLLTALGLETRRNLSRIDIENAIVRYGPGIIQNELALDPATFRLIAIPADIYTHLGPELGWGQKEVWTHFDGYRLVEGGKVQALAGGDKRFGGTHDVVSFNTAYTKDTIIARFAVVQRKRMASWQKN
jgi:hypothetical protein